MLQRSSGGLPIARLPGVTRLACLSMAVFATACAVPADDAYDASAERGVMQGKADGPPVPTKKWTFLFYGAGDNNLGDEIVTAVNSLEAVGSTADVNLVAFYDHPTLGAARVYLEQDPDPSAIHSPGIMQLGGAVDSGNPHTLIDFASWAIGSFPAEHYALIIDGHGGGSPQIIAPDDHTGSSMSLADLSQATELIYQRTHKPLAILGGDTCLTQTVEQAAQLHESVELITMSQNLDYGWDYPRIANALVADADQTPRALASEMVDAYGDHYPDLTGLTMMALDTKAALDLTAGMSLLGDTLHDWAGTSLERRATLSGVFTNVYRPEGGEDYVDVTHLGAQLVAATGDADLAYVAGELDQLVRSSSVRTFLSPDVAAAHANGLSVFLPTSLTDDVLATYRVSTFAHDSTWDEFLAWWNGLQ